MRAFDYIKEPENLLTPEIVQMIESIHEHKGKQELFLEAKASLQPTAQAPQNWPTRVATYS